VQVTKKKNKFKLGLFYLIFLFFIFFALDIACQYIIKSTFNISIYDEDYLDKKSVFYKDNQSKYYVHPYFGLASIGDKKYTTSGIASDYLFHSVTLSPKKNDIKVLLLGGSVAAFLSNNIEKSEVTQEQEFNTVFANTLNSHFGVDHFSVYNASILGGKQPQQFFKLMYLELVGFKPDIVINVDGFNELALTLSDNFDAKLPAVYPRQHNRAISRTALDNQCGDYSNNFVKSNSKIAIIELVGLIVINNCHKEITVSPTDVPYWAENNSRSYSQYVDESVKIWTKSSNQIFDFLKPKQISYIHVLQPNQYQLDSKPLSEKEKIEYLSFPYYGDHITKNYHLLSDDLIKSDNFTDLRLIFKNEKRTVYADHCCHLNALGNSLLAKKIISSNEDLFKELLH
jgi:hypothetical protein